MTLVTIFVAATMFVSEHNLERSSKEPSLNNQIANAPVITEKKFFDIKKERDQLKKQEQMRIPSMPPPPGRYETPLPVCPRDEISTKCRKFTADEMGTTIRGVRSEEHDD
jgi:hypothetical protein